MKITLQKEETFTAVAGERTLHGFTRETWHGIDRLLDPQGRELILLDGDVVRGTAALLTDLGLVRHPSFIRVPRRVIPLKHGQELIVDEFYVAERKAGQGTDGKMAHDVALKPWVNITLAEMKKAAADSGYKLLTGKQHLSLALDIASQDINWTGGKVGEGKIYQGLHRGTVSGPVDGNYESPHADERRWHQLSTGERIYDFAGHVFEALIDDLYGNANGLLTKESFGADSPYLTVPPYGVQEKGTGYRPPAGCDWSSIALFRGGFWCSDGLAGVFSLLYWSPGSRGGYVGFRCTL
jgi:hypothetical protein